MQVAEHFRRYKSYSTNEFSAFAKKKTSANNPGNLQSAISKGCIMLIGYARVSRLRPDSIDTSTPAGRFFFHVMSALAEMERELIVERTRAGLAAAREHGRIGGRRRIMTTEVVERCRRMLENGATRQQVADVIGVGVKTVYKYFPVGE
nr:recombinase family protein [Klebsiella grimontii]